MSSRTLNTSLWPKKEERSHVYIGLMKWDDFLEENAVEKVFRTEGVGSCQSRHCFIVKLMTELAPKHPNFAFPQVCWLIPDFKKRNKNWKMTKTSLQHILRWKKERSIFKIWVDYMLKFGLKGISWYSLHELYRMWMLMSEWRQEYSRYCIVNLLLLLLHSKWAEGDRWFFPIPFSKYGP